MAVHLALHHATHVTECCRWHTHCRFHLF